MSYKFNIGKFKQSGEYWPIGSLSILQFSMNKFILILKALFDKDMGTEQPNLKCKREELGME